MGSTRTHQFADQVSDQAPLDQTLLTARVPPRAPDLPEDTTAVRTPQGAVTLQRGAAARGTATTITEGHQAVEALRHTMNLFWCRKARQAA